MAGGILPTVNHESHQPAVIGAVTLTWVLLLMAFGGRLLCRRLLKMPLRHDDWLLMPAVVFATLESVVTLALMIPNGLGKHIFIYPPVEQRKKLFHLRVGIFMFQQSWCLGILFVKASMLTFYWRLFSQKKSVRFQIIFWSAIIACWFIEYTIMKLTYCKPIRGLWDDTIKLKCNIDTTQVMFVNGIVNTVTDAALLLIPLPAIWSLKLETKQKRIGLTAIFLVGIFCTAASITRLVYMKKDFRLTTSISDVPWDLVWTTTWAALELNIGVTCACLPQLRPLFMLRRAPRYQSSPTSLKSPSTEESSGAKTTNSGHAWSFWNHDLQQELRAEVQSTNSAPRDVYETTSKSNDNRGQEYEGWNKNIIVDRRWEVASGTSCSTTSGDGTEISSLRRSMESS